ncbi:FAD binding domain-containing protein [Chelatococcus reniformis]|uniref:Carbon monoxide dehydrogenase n=1 Tax=Chelatococcus reniformis TaxID=1494448 RepID=A0A916URN1_9HYPH|nr:xanthine dehydrogenase family protein subunit M [Chelatococcus reniformis]GGC85005.1 carbon monoxide dehydrogenase [Chelatococcus reniformis]
MKAFDYHRPAAVGEAAALLATLADSRPLAGGMTLLPTLKLRLAEAPALIDLSRLSEARGIKQDGDALAVGAMTCHADVAASPLAKALIPGLAQLAGSIGDPAVRNRGTIGGSLANNDPSADYPAAVLALGAVIVTSRREIPADDYFVGLFETALEPDEIILAVRLPVPRAAGYAKLRNPASRFPTVGVFVADTSAGVRVAANGFALGVARLPEFESALANHFAPDAVAGIHVDAEAFSSDIHAEAAYKAHLVGVMARRAVSTALELRGPP